MSITRYEPDPPPECLAGRSALPVDPGDGGRRGMPQDPQGQAAKPTKSAMNQLPSGLGSGAGLVGGACGWGSGMPGTVRPAPSSLGVVGERGSRHEGRSPARPGRQLRVRSGGRRRRRRRRIACHAASVARPGRWLRPLASAPSVERRPDGRLEPAETKANKTNLDTAQQVRHLQPQQAHPRRPAVAVSGEGAA